MQIQVDNKVYAYHLDKDQLAYFQKSELDGVM